jgi:hypothetical protein
MVYMLRAEQLAMSAATSRPELDDRCVRLTLRSFVARHGFDPSDLHFGFCAFS